MAPRLLNLLLFGGIEHFVYELQTIKEKGSDLKVSPRNERGVSYKMLTVYSIFLLLFCDGNADHQLGSGLCK